MRHSLKNIIAMAILIVWCASLMVSCNSSLPKAHLEKITTVDVWGSPYWGYHTPKIVRNNAGDLWSISSLGKYPHTDIQIQKKSAGGKWSPGYKFIDHYQPGMILLDNEGRLNVILNSQDRPVEHWRSSDDENLNHFELISTGNGVEDGRGWYMGAAINDDVIYLTYITLDYVCHLTTKSVTDTVWTPAKVIHDGYAHELGNHSLLYSGFEFREDNVYICGSYSGDGSVHNTYREIILKSYRIGEPDKMLSETVFKGDSGYYSFAYDLLVDPHNDDIYVAHSAGVYTYGPEAENSVDPGLYISVRESGESSWQLRKVQEGAGSIALYQDEQNALLAFITTGGWFDPNQLIVKKSTDKGENWTDVSNNYLGNQTEPLVHPYFIQAISPKSGSTVEKGVFVFSNMSDKKNADSLYVFDLYCLEL